MIASIAVGGVFLAAVISAIQIMAKNDSTPLWIVAGTAAGIGIAALAGVVVTRPTESAIRAAETSQSRTPPNRTLVGDGSVMIYAGQKQVSATIGQIDQFNSDLTFSPTGNIRGRIDSPTSVVFDRDDTTTDQLIWYRVVEHGKRSRQS